MMHRTTININRDLVQRASRILGTRGTTATVDAAMRDLVNRELRARLADWDLGGLTPEHLKQQRRIDDGIVGA